MPNSNPSAQLTKQLAERKLKAQALQDLVKATKLLANCKLQDIIKVLAYFHNTHWLYLERVATEQQKVECWDSLSFEVITGTLTNMADFRAEWPDVSLDELYSFCELMEQEG